jgi:hypothetical protein
MLGLTSVSEHLTMEVNRLAGQCSGKDAVVASTFLNLTNGMAYGAKGELRQSAGFFAAAAKANLVSSTLTHNPNLANLQRSLSPSLRSPSPSRSLRSHTGD